MFKNFFEYVTFPPTNGSLHQSFIAANNGRPAKVLTTATSPKKGDYASSGRSGIAFGANNNRHYRGYSSYSPAGS
jgi:hypothetical protein